MVGGWGFSVSRKSEDALGQETPAPSSLRSPALAFSRTLGAIHVPCLQAPEEEAHRPLPSGRLLRQAAQGRGVDTQLKLPHFEFRNCGERVSSVGSWGKRREGSALLIGTSGAPGIPPGEGGDGAQTVLRVPCTEAPLLCCPWSPRLSGLRVQDHGQNGLTGSFLGSSPQTPVEKVVGEVQGFTFSVNLLYSRHPGDSGALLFELHLGSTSLGFSLKPGSPCANLEDVLTVK